MKGQSSGVGIAGQPLPSPAVWGKGERCKNWIVWCLLALGLGCSLFVFVRWIGQPLLDQHNFRQAQTAMSAYWMAQAPGWAHWLNYETPIFGSPWKIPLEFPLYQWLVAGANLLTGLPLDALGRGLSAICFYCLLWPVGMLLRDYGISRRGVFLTAGLLMLSPVYLYWSRTFMIESTALLLSLLYLAWLRRYLVRRKALYLLLGTIAGLLGVLVKVTTFAGCVAAGGLMVAAHMVQERAWVNPRQSLRCYLPVLGGLVLCGAALELWLHHTTAVTASSYFGHILVPSNLHLWTYGTVAQRLSASLWRDAIWRRAIPQAVGSKFSLLVCLAAVVRMSPLLRTLLGSLLATFLLPFIVFTNLHVVHNYYQYANSVFLVLAVAISLWQLGESRSWLPLMLGCLLVVVGEAVTFCRAYLPSARASFSEEPVLRLASYLRQNTDPGSVLVIHGCEWNPLLAYCSQRRAIYIPSWAHRNELEALVQHPERLTDGRHISAVVEFNSGFEPVDWEMWEDFIARLARESTVAKFDQYQVFLPRGPEVWAQTIASDSLSPAMDGHTNWAKHFPADWDAAQIRAAVAANLDEAMIDGNRIHASTTPVTTQRGARLRLRGSVAGTTTGAEQLVLALCGLTNWASRFTWATTTVGVTNGLSTGPNGTTLVFEADCAIPAELPEDTYELILFQKHGGDLIPYKLWLRLHLPPFWREQVPTDWPSAQGLDLMGGADLIRLDGEPVNPRSTAPAVARQGAWLELWGWTADPAEGRAHPEVLLQLKGASTGLTRYVSARRYWRADVPKILGGSGYDFSGFRVRCSLPSGVPVDLYQLSALQKGTNHTVALDLRFGIKLEPAEKRP